MVFVVFIIPRNGFLKFLFLLQHKQTQEQNIMKKKMTRKCVWKAKKKTNHKKGKEFHNIPIVSEGSKKKGLWHLSSVRAKRTKLCVGHAKTKYRNKMRLKFSPQNFIIVNVYSRCGCRISIDGWFFRSARVNWIWTMATSKQCSPKNPGHEEVEYC